MALVYYLGDCKNEKKVETLDFELFLIPFLILSYCNMECDLRNVSLPVKITELAFLHIKTILKTYNDFNALCLHYTI